MAKKTLSYSQTGVNYDALDYLKRLAQQGALSTQKNIAGTGYKEYSPSRGESAFVLDQGDRYLAMVQEGLGTKNLVADAMFKLTGKTYYDAIAQDTVAMIVNDLITVGARPLTVLAYWATGDASWFENKQRLEDLVNGWTQACHLSGAVWGGGETPGLSGIIEKTTIDLGGSAIGVIKPKKRLALGDKLKAGDAIVMVPSSGIHANGVSFARAVAKKLKKSYATPLPSGRLFGEALLSPTMIYAKLIEDLYKAGVDIHYMVNITGHGWRKLMRHAKELTYRIATVAPVPEELQFMIDRGYITEQEAYATFNMGAGFAVYVSQKQVAKVWEISRKHELAAWQAGIVEKGPKQVIIEPKDITFTADTLGVRV